MADKIKKQSIEDFAFLSKVFENSPDGILVADVKTKRFLFANPFMCKIIGHPLKALLKLDVDNIHPKQDLPYVIAQFKKQAQGKISIAKDIPILRKDKKVVYCDVKSNIIKLGKQECMMGFFRDVTKEKGTKEKLQKLNEDMERKVKELERFEKVSVGRELKMIELKSRIHELEYDLKKLRMKQGGQDV